MSLNFLMQIPWDVTETKNDTVIIIGLHIYIVYIIYTYVNK